MVSNTKTNNQDNSKTLVYDHKLSSVGAGNLSGNNTVYEPNNIDLALKLHYLKVLYFLDNKAVDEFTVRKIKESSFEWLNYYYEICGRFRRSENGRPYIKCNDCGVRFTEAKTSKTIQEWLLMEEKDGSCEHHRLLLPQHHVIGPELTFSPLVFIQITFFKCGGMSLGLSWAHVLGDAFSVSNCMNMLAQFLNGNPPNYPAPVKRSPPIFQKPIKDISPNPLSVYEVGPVGDLWIKPTSCEMDTFSFRVTRTQLARLQKELSGGDQSVTQLQPFEAVCGIIWQAIAKVKVGPKPNVVTIVKKDGTGPIEDQTALRNNQVVGSVTVDFLVEEAHPKELAALIRDWTQDERAQIGELVDRDPGASDVIVYGSKLTFVDLEDVNFYGFVIKDLSPKFVHCFMDGIGEEGVVLVLPTPQKGDETVTNAKGEAEGRIVTLTLPRSYMAELKEELKREWNLIA